MKPGEEPLTAEQLAIAWRQMRRPLTWPGTLEEAMADPSREKCIRGYARSLARSVGRPPFRPTGAAPAHSLPAAAVPPTPAEAPVRRLPPTRQHMPRFDARKAAANDFDD